MVTYTKENLMARLLLKDRAHTLGKMGMFILVNTKKIYSTVLENLFLQQEIITKVFIKMGFVTDKEN